MPRNWFESEPGLTRTLPELVRLYRRAWLRLPVTIAVAVLVSLALVGAVRLKKHTFSPQVVLRAVEADHQAGVAPRPKRKLRDYVQQAVFSNRGLAEIMHTHGVYSTLARTNPQMALTLFKEDIQVDVYRNFFVEERMSGDPPRSARIAIRYRAEDSQVALGVARDLAKLVRDHEKKSRASQFERAAQEADRELSLARAALLEQRRTISEKMQRTPADPQTQVEVANLERSSTVLERRVKDAVTRKPALDLSAPLGAEPLGLRLELVDSGAVSQSSAWSGRDYFWLGILGFLFGFPLVAPFVGAFDSRVRDAGDLERLGIGLLGQIRVSNEKLEGYG